LSYRHPGVRITVNKWEVTIEPVFLLSLLLLESFLVKNGLAFGLIKPIAKAFFSLQPSFG
jgi:hypothetical protein